MHDLRASRATERHLRSSSSRIANSSPSRPSCSFCTRIDELSDAQNLYPQGTSNESDNESSFQNKSSNHRFVACCVKHIFFRRDSLRRRVSPSSKNLLLLCPFQAIHLVWLEKDTRAAYPASYRGRQRSVALRYEVLLMILILHYSLLWVMHVLYHQPYELPGSLRLYVASRTARTTLSTMLCESEPKVLRRRGNDGPQGLEANVKAQCQNLWVFGRHPAAGSLITT